jgi:hypothetical protein
VIHGLRRLADTKTNPGYYRLAHLGYGHPAILWDEAELARHSVPWPVDIDPLERIDIDRPEDLEFARVVAAGLAARGSPRIFAPGIDEFGAAACCRCGRSKACHAADGACLPGYEGGSPNKPDGIHAVNPYDKGWIGRVDF